MHDAFRKKRIFHRLSIYFVRLIGTLYGLQTRGVELHLDWIFIRDRFYETLVSFFAGAVTTPRKGLSAPSRVSTDRAGTSRISMSG